MEEKDIKIKKAKLSKSGYVEATYTDDEGNEITLKGIKKAHPDMRTALDALVPYFADLTEQKEADAIDWEDTKSAYNIDLLRRLKVTGVSVGGDDSNRFVTISGNRTLLTSRVLNLNSPGVELDSETFEWPHIDQFAFELEGFFYEVKEYILHHKYDTAQQEFNFEADPADPFGDGGEAPAPVPMDMIPEDVA